MLVKEASNELIKDIMKYFYIAEDEDDKKERILNDLLYNVRSELIRNYHYDDDKKFTMKLIKQIDATGTWKTYMLKFIPSVSNFLIFLIYFYIILSFLFLFFFFLTHPNIFIMFSIISIIIGSVLEKY